MPILYNQMYEYAATAPPLPREGQPPATNGQSTARVGQSADPLQTVPARPEAAGAKQGRRVGKDKGGVPAGGAPASLPPVLPYVFSAALHVLAAGAVVPWAFRRARGHVRRPPLAAPAQAPHGE